MNAIFEELIAARRKSIADRANWEKVSSEADHLHTVMQEAQKEYYTIVDRFFKEVDDNAK